MKKVYRLDFEHEELDLDSLERVAGGMQMNAVMGHMVGAQGAFGSPTAHLSGPAPALGTPHFAPPHFAGAQPHFGFMDLVHPTAPTVANGLPTLPTAPAPAATGPLYGYFDQNHVFHQLPTPAQSAVQQPQQAQQNPFAQATSLMSALRGFMPQGGGQQQRGGGQQQQQQQQQRQQQEERDENGFTAQERAENARQDAQQDREFEDAGTSFGGDSVEV